MIKRTLLGLLPFLLFQLSVFAQTSISGRVVDESGQGIPGASVKVKGKTIGAKSNMNGNFKLTNVKAGETLVITSIGMFRQEVKAQNNMKVVMKQNNSKLGKVVITALGIKKEAKKLGYANTVVDEDVLSQGQNGNAMTALSGKVAGLNVITSSGTPGASNFIQLRGFNTFNSDHKPLIIVDGIPVSIAESAVGDDLSPYNERLTNVSTGNGGLDINPDDIENVSVLKGPGATALYGSQGSNGVIMITTKSGKGAKGGVRVTYNTSMVWDKVSRMPGLQNTYLQGRGGQFAGPANPSGAHYRESWGPMKDTMYWDGDNSYPWDKNGYAVGQSNPSAKTPFTPYDNTGDFFQTGQTFRNDLSVMTANDKSSLRVSYSNLKQTGIIPLSGLRRNTIGLKAITAPTDRLSIATTFNYANTRGNYVQQGSNLSGIMLGLLRTPISFDNANGYGKDAVDNEAAYLFEDGRMRSFRGYGIYDNPYYTINNNTYNDERNRMYGNLTATYQLSPTLSITNRFGGDLSMYNSQQNYGVNTWEIDFVGQVRLRTSNSRTIDNNLMLRYTPNVHKDLDVDILLGNNVLSSTTTSTYTRGDNLLVSNWYHINGTENKTVQQGGPWKNRSVSNYYSLSLGYKGFLYGEATGRLENSTAYWPNYKPNFYTSYALSYIFSDHLHISKKHLTFGKARLSWASVGKNPPGQSTFAKYSQASVGADGWTTGLSNPINGAQAFEIGSLFDPNLSPEKTRSLEFGLDLRFLKNRIALDYTYYNSLSKDLFVFVPLPASSGHTNYFTNAGEVLNKGHEVQLRLTPIKKKDMRWDVVVNYSRNRTTVNKIADGVEQIEGAGFTGSQIVIRQDEGYNVFYGNGYHRDAAGNVLISDDTSSGGRRGYPVLDPSQKNLGSALPDWLGGINNIFTYKNWSLNMLWQTRQGGVIWNGTRGALSHFGMSEETEGRDTDTKTFDGVYGHIGADGEIYHYAPDGSEVKGPGTANGTEVALDDSYYFGGEGSGFVTNEPFVEDASWVRLRELGINYNFGGKLLKKNKYIKGARIGFVARNLFLFTNYQGVDPETSLIGGGKSQGLDYFNNPGTKSYGVNLKLNF